MNSQTAKPIARSITIWAYGTYYQFLNRAIAIYKEETGSKDEFYVKNLNSSSELESRVEEGYNTGDLPDLILTGDDEIKKFALIHAELLLPMNEYIDLNDFAAFKITDVSVDGNIYGYPCDVGTVGIFYRKDLMDQAGIEFSESINWVDYNNIAEQLESFSYGYKMPSLTIEPEILLKSFGHCGYIDGSYSSDNADEIFNVIQTLTEHECIDDTPTDYDHIYESIRAGQIFALIGAPWWAQKITELTEDGNTAQEWRVSRIPKFDGYENEVNIYGCSSAIINKGQDVINIIDFLNQVFSGNENIVKCMAEEYNLVPAWINGIQYLEDTSDNHVFGDQAVIKYLSNLQEWVPEIEVGERSSEQMAAINNTSRRIVCDALTADEALDEYTAICNSLNPSPEPTITNKNIVVHYGGSKQFSITFENVKMMKTTNKK